VKKSKKPQRPLLRSSASAGRPRAAPRHRLPVGGAPGAPRAPAGARFSSAPGYGLPGGPPGSSAGSRVGEASGKKGQDDISWSTPHYYVAAYEWLMEHTKGGALEREVARRVRKGTYYGQDLVARPRRRWHLRRRMYQNPTLPSPARGLACGERNSTTLWSSSESKDLRLWLSIAGGRSRHGASLSKGSHERAGPSALMASRGPPFPTRPRSSISWPLISSP